MSTLRAGVVEAARAGFGIRANSSVAKRHLENRPSLFRHTAYQILIASGKCSLHIKGAFTN